MRRMLSTVLLMLLFGASSLQAQTITKYTFIVYDQGASSPILAPNDITQWTCGLTSLPSNASTVNPTTLEWADPADATKACRADQTTYLISIPFGQSGSRLLDGVLTATGPGGTSAESNRAPFERRAEAPLAPSAFRVVR